MLELPTRACIGRGESIWHNSVTITLVVPNTRGVGQNDDTIVFQPIFVGVLLLLTCQIKLPKGVIRRDVCKVICGGEVLVILRCGDSFCMCGGGCVLIGGGDSSGCKCCDISSGGGLLGEFW